MSRLPYMGQVTLNMLEFYFEVLLNILEFYFEVLLNMLEYANKKFVFSTLGMFCTY
jgi:hypothetical protein